MQNLPLDKQIRIAINELIDKRRLLSIVFTVISLSVITIGLYWPRIYEPSTTLLWNRVNVLQPLLEGTAVSATLSEQASLAKEVIYSAKNLDILIEKVELDIKDDGQRMSAREIELLKDELRKNIMVGRSGDRVITISYRHKVPEVAYLVVSIISSLFIEETTQNKKSSSKEAYEFIEKQVLDYQTKLQKINQNIDEFKERNVEFQVDSTRDVNTRVLQLREALNNDRLLLNESRIQKQSLEEQMLEESRRNIVEDRETINEERLRSLEDQLNTLRLSYTETYPDIIQIKEQIRNLKSKIEEDILNSKNEKPSSRSGTDARRVSGSELYARLNQQHSQLITQIKTLQARISDNEETLRSELSRSTEVNAVASRLEELSRDYEVTQSIYDDLLRRRENARVSLNLELENAGTLFKVHEPPVIPIVPAGLRFLHFAIGSVILGAVIPVGIIIGLLIIDQRVRDEDDFLEDDDYPVIGVISTYKIQEDKRRELQKTIQSFFILLVAGSALVAISLSRYFGVI